MRPLRKLIRYVLAGSAIIVVAPLLAVKLLYGGGHPFPSVSTAAATSDVEVAATLELPPGCVTVAPDGRVFFDTHPFAAPERFGAPHVFELVDGEARPWPSAKRQDLFVAPFGITADDHGRVWVTEPATSDRDATRILGFDRETGDLVFEHTLPAGEARFAQDLRISPDGNSIVLADTGAFAFTPGQLVVVDIAAKKIVRRFQHESLNPQDWIIRRFDGDPHRVLWGLVTFQVGVDGITFSADRAWLYYATMSHDTLYRVPTAVFLDPTRTAEAIAEAVEAVGRKPQTDGIASTADGRIIVTDIEHGGIAELTATGSLRTLTASADVVWADSVAVAPDGAIWFTDSAIPAYLQPTMVPPDREVFDAVGPFHIYRFKVP